MSGKEGFRRHIGMFKGPKQRSHALFSAAHMHDDEPGFAC